MSQPTGDPAQPQPNTTDGSLFMRPFAYGMTAYLWVYNLLYAVTSAEFKSPDNVSDIYFFVMAYYAGAPEVKRWATQRTEDPNTAGEYIRKGGPIVTLWFLLWAGLVLVRIKDPTIPMPPELKTILWQIMTIFFGTYALRQVRKSGTRKASETPNETVDSKARILQFVRDHEPCSPQQIREGLDIPRSTVARLLAELVALHQLQRDAKSPQDPNATYRLS